MLSGILGCLLVVIFGAVFYSRVWSAPALAKRAGATFVEAALQGESSRVDSLLASDAGITGAQSVALFSGLAQARVSHVMKALPNLAGVEYIVQVIGYSDDGHPRATSLLLRRDKGSWVIVSAGQAVSY